jgi:hypothetical protein
MSATPIHALMCAKENNWDKENVKYLAKIHILTSDRNNLNEL